MSDEIKWMNRYFETFLLVFRSKWIHLKKLWWNGSPTCSLPTSLFLKGSIRGIASEGSLCENLKCEPEMFISLSLSSIDICPIFKYLVKKCIFEMVEISCNFVNRLYCFSKSIRKFFSLQILHRYRSCREPSFRNRRRWCCGKFLAHHLNLQL
jgi:hypothetical protein